MKTTRIIYLLFLIMASNQLAIGQIVDIDVEVAFVQNNINQNNWDEALERLSDLRSRCNEKLCLAKIDFTQGYLFQRMHQNNLSETYADSAVYYYQSVLKAFPENKASRNNLLLIYSTSKSPGELLKSIENTPAKFLAPYYFMAGDLFIEAKKYDSALYAYNKASTVLGYREEAYNRMLKMFRIGDLSDEYIFQQIFTMETFGYYDLSRIALLDLINKDYTQHNKFNDKAFVWWIKQAQQLQNVSSYVKTNVSKEWGHQSVLFVNELNDNEASLNWWVANKKYEIVPELTLQTRDVICSYLLALGKEATRDDNIKKGLDYTNMAMVKLTNDRIERYLAGGGQISNVFFAIAEELGMLYTNYAEITDPTGTAFTDLESKLFGGKSVAYLEMNRSAIKNFHTALGLIYAERGIWVSNRRYRNGIFQLENAIEKSPEGANIGYLANLLAGGYLSPQVRQPKKAQALLERAIMSHLNFDDFAAAKSAMSKYDKIGLSFTTKYKQIVDVYNYRLNLEKLSRDSFQDTSLLTNTLSQIPEISKEDYFNKLQKFKIYNDLGDKAAAYGFTSYSYDFYKIAIDEASQIEHFSNSADIIRLKNQFNVWNNSAAKTIIQVDGQQQIINKKLEKVMIENRSKLSY